MYDGKNIINETEEQIKTGDELKVQLTERYPCCAPVVV